jgi:hypothetical protein
MTYLGARLQLPLELRPPLLAKRCEGVTVRLSDSYLDSVVYVGFGDPAIPGKIDIQGTAFFVAHDEALYLVTAAHVAKCFKDVPFSIRLNDERRKAYVDQVESATWVNHPNDDVDVAVMRYDPPAKMRVTAIRTKEMLIEFKRWSKNIGVGDLAYVVGVYKYMSGKERNIPVVHTGHIASMADGEPLPTKDWTWDGDPDDAPTIRIKGYLVQVPTLEQSSGSPVFVRRSLETLAIPKDETTPVRSWQYGSVWFLGLWHGAWTSRTCEELGVPGVGVGITVPATFILEALDQPKVKAMRDKEKAKRVVAATPQSGRQAGDSQLRDSILKNLLTSPPEPRKKTPKSKAKKS